MDALNRRWLAVVVVALLAMTARVHAQDAGTIDLFAPVEGRVDAEAQTWTFNGRTNEPVSFLAETTGGSLDPVLTVRTSTGTVLVSNDDVFYPTEHNALLEAITIPTLGLYTVSVSGFHGTTGSYRLTMLPGYGKLASTETFDSASKWAGSDGLTVTGASGALNVALAQGQRTGFARQTGAPTYSDFHAQIDVTSVSGSGWIVGLEARHTDAGSYVYEVNDRGEWRFVLDHADGETVLRDWGRHPAIRAGQTQFSLGLMATGAGFDFFYSGDLVGRFSDTTLADAGTMGLFAGSAQALGANISFDNLSVTVPLTVDGAAVVPQQLIVSDAMSMVQALTRQRLIGANGELKLNVAQSSTEHSGPGVDFITLGRGLTFTNFALAATVTMQNRPAGQGGCGLIFRATDLTHYDLAYLDGTGAYGLSQRDGEGFKPGLFGQLMASSAPSHHLLIIANDHTLLYYVDGQYVGTLDQPSVDGGIGNAVVNFESMYTSCQFNNTWVWRWG